MFYLIVANTMPIASFVQLIILVCVVAVTPMAWQVVQD